MNPASGAPLRLRHGAAAKEADGRPQLMDAVARLALDFFNRRLDGPDLAGLSVVARIPHGLGVVAILAPSRHGV